MEQESHKDELAKELEAVKKDNEDLTSQNKDAGEIIKVLEEQLENSLQQNQIMKTQIEESNDVIQKNEQQIKLL